MTITYETGYIDKDSSMAANSDHLVPSQSAMKTNVDAITASIATKVDKVTGEGLSTNDYTNAEKAVVANQSGTNTGDQNLSALATTAAMTTALAGKEPSITGTTIKDYFAGDKAFHRSKVSLSYTVSTTSGSVIIYLTSNGLSTGTALFASVDYVHLDFVLNNPNLGKSYTLSGDLKTLTITAVTQTFTGVTVIGINVLGSVAIAAATNGTQLSVLVQGTPV